MDAEDRVIVNEAKGYWKQHKVELILMGVGAILGAGVGYFLWLWDVL
ncbi:MAG: hypothetical protein Q3X66_00560 [Evtepia sp.]|nr:hypothetical protein [Evtepia sp.]